ncbi:hypothetical protein FRC05_009993 [Tulasnella sp. 425]|nr:hypothetical protein FRC05_009993 [Tulasnella sp. 425]
MSVSPAASPIVPTPAAVAPPAPLGPAPRGPRKVFRIKLLLANGGNSRFIGVQQGNAVVAYVPSQAARLAKLRLVDDRGLSRAQPPIPNAITITSWKLSGNNLQAAPQGGYPSSIDLYIQSSESQWQGRPIRAYLNRTASHRLAPEVQFVNLQLEED